MEPGALPQMDKVQLSEERTQRRGVGGDVGWSEESDVVN